MFPPPTTAVRAPRVHSGPVRGLLRHAEPVTIGTEGHLCGADRASGQHARRADDRRERTIGSDAEAADIAGTARVQHVDLVAMNAEADRPDTTGRHAARER